jgi:hypothetical protein
VPAFVDRVKQAHEEDHLRLTLLRVHTAYFASTL